ncbi:MAG: flavodoxin family protein [Bacteroidota bacterium]
MKIGIIVHSQTGNTYSVAQKLKEKLAAAGHAVDLERLKAVGEVKPGTKDVRFESLPDIGWYEALVFGAPVQGFSLAPAMASYLAQIGSLQGKKVACLVTQHLPHPWMGGNRTVGQMKRICEAKGAVFCGSGIVNWTNKRREQKIVEVVEGLDACINK